MVTKKNYKEKKKKKKMVTLRILHENNDGKAKKTRTHTRRKQCTQTVFFSLKMAPAQITLHILIVMVILSII